MLRKTHIAYSDNDQSKGPTAPCDQQVVKIPIRPSKPSYNIFRTEEMTTPAGFIHVVARTRDPDFSENSTQNGSVDHFEGPHGMTLLPHLPVIGVMLHHIKL